MSAAGHSCQLLGTAEAQPHIILRVFSGIASSVEPILYGILSKATTVEERSAVIAQHMLMRELGLIFGPLLNLGFKDIHYEITGTNIVINQYTMPGRFQYVLYQN